MRLHLAWLFALVAASAAAQTPAPGAATGLILGRVVDGTSGRPLGDVTVTLAGPPAQTSGTTPRVMTSGNGYFVFAGLRRGGYTISAAKSGYVPGAQGKQQPTASGQPFDLLDGERRGDITIPMWRYAAIGGTVVDEAGEPLVGMPVRVLRRTIVGGTWQLTPAGSQPMTDDRGVYRSAQLVPGDYVAAVVTTIATVSTSMQDAYTDGVATGTISPYQAGVDAGGGSPLSLSGGVRVGDFLLKTGGGGLNGPAPDAPRIVPPRADGRLLVYPTLYYPAGTTATQATVITLASGEERSDIDFQPRPVPSLRIAGTVVGPGPSSNTAVALFAAGIESIAREQSFESAITVSDAAGRFTFLGVAAGDYTIKVLRAPARPASGSSAGNSITVQVGGSTITSMVMGPPPPIPNAPTVSGVLPVSVIDRDVTGAMVTLRDGARLGGHIEFVGAAPKPTADQLRRVFVNIDPADGHTPGAGSNFQIWQGQIDADGQLTSYQLPPGRYVIRSGSLPGWTFAGATLDGKDITDAPFELGTTDVTRVLITYSDRQADLSGTVRDEARAPNAAAEVILFPADPRAWMGYGTVARRLRNASPRKDGTFIFAGVPPGDYYLAAAPPGTVPDWQNPTTLQRLVSSAVTVTVGDAEKKTQDVVVKPVRPR
ncbi:MAG: carboxypeptidase-like regulatory domain-containing protein [Acidobacteriota bacterium]